MSVSLSPLFNAFQGFLPSGLPNNAGLIYTYAAGSSTPLATFNSSSGIVANSNPIVLNSSGYVPNEIWLTDGLSYKFYVTDSLGNPIGTYDNVLSSGSLIALYSSISSGISQAFADGRYPFYAGVAGGTSDALTATASSAAITSLYDGMIVSIDAQAANATATPTLSLTLGVSVTGTYTIVKNNLQPLVAGDIAGAYHCLLLQYHLATTQWVLLNPVGVTTSYVNSKLGNFQSVVGIGSSTSLTTTQSGSWFEVSASGITVTLPAPSTSNLTYTILNLAGFSGSVTTAGTANTLTTPSGAIYGCGTSYGASISLQPGVIYHVASDGTNWQIIGGTSLGVGSNQQSYQNLTASRAFGTTYYNTTGRPIFVSVYGTGSPSSCEFTVVVNGVTLGNQGVTSVASASMWMTMTFIVPPNGSYSASNVNGATLSSWVELR